MVNFRVKTKFVYKKQGEVYMERLLQAVPKLNILKDKSNPFYDNIKEMIEYADNMLKEIKTTFRNYTNHDIGHSFNVIRYMCDAVSDLNQLSDLEITVIIYAGLLHDIGMVVSPNEKELVKNNKYTLSSYNFNSVLENCNGDEVLAIQEIIRPIHAIRSKEHIINTMMRDKAHLFSVPDINGVYFDKIVADICVAHNEEFEWIKLHLSNNKVLGKYSINPQYIAILLRLADLLDVDSSRAPDYLYNLIAPNGKSDDEWKQHFIITNSNKIIDSDNGIKYIEFYGETEDAKIHRKLLNYFDFIKKELECATDFLYETTNEKYHLNISTNIRNHITPKNFEFSNFKLSLDYKSITNLLMGENIYNNKRCGLREIIQNSIDACKLMKEEARNLDEYKYRDYHPEITIVIDEVRKTASIYDNGIGMSFDIIKKYFLNVGVSYYNSNDCKYRGYSYIPIGNYGIGFLSCFMLSNNVQIRSKRFDSDDTIIIDIEKDNEYVVFSKSSEHRPSFTEIILDETFFNAFPSKESVISYIEETFLNSSIDITIKSIEASNEQNSYKCNLLSLTSTGKDDICLTKYLNNFEAYATINKNLEYIKTLDDYSNTNYIYENNRFSKYDASKHNIDKLIIENELTYITIVFIPNSMSEKLESYYEALGDYKEAIEKTEECFDTINIFYNNDECILYKHNEHLVIDISNPHTPNSYYEQIFHGFSVYDLLNQIDSSDLSDTDLYSIYIYDNNHQSIVGCDENNYLIFYKDYYYAWQNRRKRLLYVRNVLINHFAIHLPSICYGIRINEIIVNVLNKNVVPDISRSNLQEDVTLNINYALGKAIHLWILENNSLSPSEKSVLVDFINLNYCDPNPFVSGSYDGLINNGG